MKLISFGTTFLSLEELTLVLTLLFVVAGFLIVIGFRKAGFAMIGSALVLALLPVFEPFLDPILTLMGTSINPLSNLDFIYDDQIFSFAPNLKCERHDILLFFGYFSNFRPLRAHLSCRCVSDNWKPASRRT